jgi:hypothetical protein
VIGVVLVVGVGLGPVINKRLGLVAVVVAGCPEQVNLGEAGVRHVRSCVDVIKRAILCHVLHHGPPTARVGKVVGEACLPLVLPPDTRQRLSVEVRHRYIGR